MGDLELNEFDKTVGFDTVHFLHVLGVFCYFEVDLGSHNFHFLKG